MLNNQSTPTLSGRPAIDFGQLAADEALGKATAEDAALLRQPENLDEWRDAITGLIQQTDAEFSKRRALLAQLRDPSRHTREQYHEGVREHAKWSSRANHFQAQLRARLAEVKRLQRQRNDLRQWHDHDRLTSRIDAIEDEMARLRTAVTRAVEEVRT